jgi:hypothetical protein
MGGVRRDVVSFRGRSFARREGTIGVEEVLLARQGARAPGEARVVWGRDTSWQSSDAVLSYDVMHRRGIWFLSSTGEGAFCPQLLTDGSEFFVPDEEIAAFRARLAGEPPYAAELEVRDGRLLLVVRYVNFADQPKSLALWDFDDGSMLVPGPFAARLTETNRNGGPDLVLAQSIPLEDGESVSVAPHSFVERTEDISELAPGRGPDYLWLRLTTEIGDRRLDRSWPEPAPREWMQTDDPEDIVFYVADVGRPILWLPSAGRLLALLLVAGPVLLAGTLILHARQASRMGWVFLGALLGIVWAWIITAFGIDAFVMAFSRSLDGARPNRPAAFVVLVCVLLVVPAATGILAFGRRKQRTRRGIWLIWVPWLLLPLVALAVDWVVQGTNMFV